MVTFDWLVGSPAGGYSPRPNPDQSVETVRLENQMIAAALHEQLSSSSTAEDSDGEDSCGEGDSPVTDDVTSTVRHMPTHTASLLNIRHGSEPALQQQQSEYILSKTGWCVKSVM